MGPISRLRQFFRKMPDDLVTLPHIPPRQALRENLSACAWPNIYYPITSALIDSIGAKSVLEIGVAYGYHAASMLARPSAPKYLGIDPYLAGYDPKDFFVSDVHRLMRGSTEQASMDLLFEAVRSELADLVGSRAEVWRGIGGDFEDTLKSSQAQFDFIWVDGDHQFEAVISDLELGLSLLKPGGILAGDDYNWPEVKQAVATFSARNSLQCHLVTNVNRGGYQCFVLTRG